MSKIPKGMVRKRGMFNTIEYEYKRIRIMKDTGRYAHGWVFYIGTMILSNRYNASTLVEAGKIIDGQMTNDVLDAIEENEREMEHY